MLPLNGHASHLPDLRPLGDVVLLPRPSMDVALDSGTRLAPVASE